MRRPLKVTIAGKGGVGKTTISALVARRLAARDRDVLAVDCDPNPTLAEEFGLRSAELPAFTHEGGLRRAGRTLELDREPELREVGDRLWLIGGPPSRTALADAVARGIAGVLLAPRFDVVITDLGAGPELAEASVGGVLDPSDVCIVLSNGRPVAELTARRIAEACGRREVDHRLVLNRPGAAGEVADDIATELIAGHQH